MKATWSTTWVQLSSLLSRTPKEADKVSPLAQIPSKPASSKMRAESPSWASIMKAMSGRVTRRRSWVVVRMGCPPLRASARAEAVAKLVRRVGNARDIGLLGRHLREDEVWPVAVERRLHRLGDPVGVGHGGHGAVSGRFGQPIKANLGSDRSLTARGPVDLVVEHNVDEAPRVKRRDEREDAEVHEEIAVAVEHDRRR